MSDDFLARRRAAIQEQKDLFAHFDRLSIGYRLMVPCIKQMSEAGLNWQEIASVCQCVVDEITSGLGDEHESSVMVGEPPAF